MWGHAGPQTLQPALPGPPNGYARATLCDTEIFVAHPIHVEGLKKNYGDFPAVKGIDFEVRAGRVLVLDGDPEVQTRQLKDRQQWHRPLTDASKFCKLWHRALGQLFRDRRHSPRFS